MTEPIAGYNSDGSPYYGPDALGIFIGKIDGGTSNVFGPGPTSSNLLAAGIPGASNANGVGAEPAQQQVGLFDALGYAFGFGTQDQFNQVLDPSGAIGATASTVSKTVSGVSGFLTFVTDLPRVATTIVGLILIIAGIFALSRGPAIQVIGSAVQAAATS